MIHIVKALFKKINLLASINFYFFINREVLGDDLICVHLQMEKEDKMKRLLKRHEGAEKFVEIVEVCYFYTNI